MVTPFGANGVALGAQNRPNIALKAAKMAPRRDPEGVSKRVLEKARFADAMEHQKIVFSCLFF